MNTGGLSFLSNTAQKEGREGGRMEGGREVIEVREVREVKEGGRERERDVVGERGREEGGREGREMREGGG